MPAKADSKMTDMPAQDTRAKKSDDRDTDQREEDETGTRGQTESDKRITRGTGGGRVLSERRRVQNRAAQKNYREKQKKRLRTLESLLIGTQLADHETTAASASSSGALDFSGPDIPVSRRSDSVGLQAELSLIPPFGLEPENEFPGLDIHALGVDYQSELAQRGLAVPSFGATDYLADDLRLTPWDSERGLEMPLEASLATAQTRGASRQRHVADSRLDREGDEPLGKELGKFLLQDESAIGKTATRQIVEKNISLADILRLGLRALNSKSTEIQSAADHVTAALQRQREAHLPSLQANTIRITHMSFLAACINNAILLGLSASAASDDNAVSPFYAPALSSEATDRRARVFADIKPDLRPTTHQLTHSHHPYLDVLPFPTFRQRAIALLHTTPPVFDEEELCRDLLNDALICWGSCLGPRMAGSGAPWDIRSWEAKPWFLKKWWMLTGGPEAEMCQQTRWWCEMRGDHSGYPW